MPENRQLIRGSPWIGPLTTPPTTATLSAMAGPRRAVSLLVSYTSAYRSFTTGSGRALSRQEDERYQAGTTILGPEKKKADGLGLPASTR